MNATPKRVGLRDHGIVNKHKILIVEDEYIIATDIQSMLYMRGMESTKIAINGEEAISEVKKDPPHLILMDIVLSGKLDGIETAAIIKKEYDIPVVYLTAHTDNATVRKAKITEPHGYLLKPINEMDLYTTIEIAIYKHGIDRRLRESEEKYRDLAYHLQTLREEERTQISREIHDELGQTLTALRMDLFWLQENIAGHDGRLLNKVGSMMGLVDDTIEKVRKISSYLRPGILDDLGLSAALEWLADDTSGRCPIKCTVNITPPHLEVDAGISTDIFRIVQESLTNITRHAKATRAEISLSERDDHIFLDISDNGIGISAEHVNDTRSFGLIGIRERAAFHSGEALIGGIAGSGTTISVKIPKYNKSEKS